VSVLERGRVVTTRPPAELVNDPRVMEAYLGMAERAAGPRPAGRADSAPAPERGPSHG
jgi:Branched-chain amino acid ATP-binding cassette transporter